jgi:hypothetical protein
VARRLPLLPVVRGLGVRIRTFRCDELARTYLMELKLSSCVRALGCISLISIAISCGDDTSNILTLGPSSANGHTFTLTNVRGGRTQGGGYIYDLRYSVRNDSNQLTSYSLRDFAVFGPADETLPGFTSQDLGRSFEVSAHSSATGFLSLFGSDASQPYAERLRARIEYQSGGKRGVLDDEDIVLHGPQTARLHDFSMSPPGYETIPPSTPPVPLGQTVTVRWNVEGASLVILESSLPMTSSGGQRFREQVEPVGSRTFTTQRTGVAFADLDVDRGLIRRSLLINVQ